MSEVKNIGIVTEVRDGIVMASGLSGVGYNEMVDVHTTSGEVVSGLALNLEEASTGIVILGDFSKIKEGDQITSTGKQLSINVSEEILGHIINPLGKNLKGDMDFVVKNGEEMLLDRIAPGIIDRKNVNNEKLFTTGIMAIDALIPIGRGQRELIIGDRQTGKTSVVMPIIVNQKGKDIVCIYVAIGKKSSQIANIRSKLEKLGCLGYTVIVSANASDPAAMQYIAPYAGCAIGEYFAQKGQHALVIYDDLTKHAWAYREISLLLKRPAGREAYPGDIFYLHSKLLERAVQLSDKNGGGSLTALPLVETQADDVSAYIPTNIISITDGQIYLSSDLFNAGYRPAINVGLSVSRVGGSAQIKAMKKVAGRLKLDLAQTRELQVFAQFGSDLDDETKQKLVRGERLSEILKQDLFDLYDLPSQIAMIYAATNGYLDNVELKDIKRWKKKFLEYFAQSGKAIVKAIDESRDFTEETETLLKQVLEQFVLPADETAELSMKLKQSAKKEISDNGTKE